HEAESEQSQSAAQNEHEHLRAQCAQRDADSELARAPADLICEHTVEADRRKEEREAGEHSEEKRVEFRLAERFVNPSVERAHVPDRLVGIDGGDSAANGTSERGGVA